MLQNNLIIKTKKLIMIFTIRDTLIFDMILFNKKINKK